MRGPVVVEGTCATTWESWEKLSQQGRPIRGRKKELEHWKMILALNVTRERKGRGCLTMLAVDRLKKTSCRENRVSKAGKTQGVPHLTFSREKIELGGVAGSTRSAKWTKRIKKHHVFPLMREEPLNKVLYGGRRRSGG